MVSYTRYYLNKIKFINAKVPEKIKVYIHAFLEKEINYFQKKYGYKIEITGDPNLVVPEYIINLLNKNKKIVNKVENYNKIENIENEDKRSKKKLKSKNLSTQPKKLKAETDKKSPKKKSKPRTLWIRKKKK